MRLLPLVLALFAGCSPATPRPTLSDVRPAPGPASPPMAAAPPTDAAPATPKDADWALVATLASDDLEGRAPGSEGSRKARAAIISELERCGVAPGAGASFERPIDPSRGRAVNVFGLVAGTEPDRHVILSAHYDHLGIVHGEIMNGADDNAAAVGSVVKVACALAAGPRPRASLLVAFWDAEEPPAFLGPGMGSRAWVEAPHVPLASIEAAIVLDLVGGGLWPGSPVHVALGAESSPALTRAIAETPAPHGLIVTPAGLHLVEALVTGDADTRQPWSDYDAFRNAKVPFVFLSNGQTAHYHTASDDFVTLDLPKLARQTTWLTHLVRHLLDLSPADAPRWAPLADTDPAARARDLEAATRLVTGALASTAFDPFREALTADLEALRAEASAHTLRAAVQRIQCLASRQHPPALCARL